MGEGVLSEVLVKGDRLLLTVKDRGTVYVDWLHQFPSGILDAKRREELCQELAHLSPVKYDRIPQFNIMQITAPISSAKQLPEDILRGHYTQAARWRYSPAWTFVDVDAELEKLLSEKFLLDAEMNHISSRMAEALQNSKKGKRLKHFEENVAKNWSKLDKILDDELRQRKQKFEAEAAEFAKKAGLQGAKTELNPENKCIDIILPTTEKIKPLEKSFSADDILNSKIYFFDIEKPLFKTEIDEVSWLAETVTEKGAVTKKTVRTINSLESKLGGWRTKCYKTERDLVAQAAEDIAVRDSNGRTTDVIVAYNAPFDIQETREVGEFFVGERESEPKIEVSMDFFRKMKIYGRLIIDPMRWAKTAFGYLPNRKLELIARHVLGSEFAKSMDYDQLADLEMVCKTGSIEKCLPKTLEFFRGYAPDSNFREIAGSIIRKYVTKDVEVMRQLLFSPEFKKSLEDCCWMSRHFKIDISRLLHSPNTINDAQERCYHHFVGSYREIVYLKTKKMALLEQRAKQHFEEIVHEHIKGKSRPGLHHQLYKLFVPVGDFMRNAVVKRFENAKAFFDYKYQFIEDSQRQYFLSQYANALASYIIVDYARQKKTEKSFFEEIAKKELTIEEFKQHYTALEKSILTNSENAFWAKRNLKLGTLSASRVTKYLPESSKKKLAEKEIGDEKFAELLNLYARKEKLERKVAGQYANRVQEIDGLLRNKFEKVNKFLSDKGFQVVHKQGNFIYVKGGSLEELTGKNAKKCPLILVDKIDSAYVATNPSDSLMRGKIFGEYEHKIYYFKHGYPFGIKLKDEQDSLSTMYEMSCYSDSLKAILGGDFAGCLKTVRDYLGKLKKIVDEKEAEVKGLEKTIGAEEKHLIDRDSYEHLNTIDKNELVWLRKEGKVLADGSQPKKPRYSAFENGGKIYFYDREEYAEGKQILFDEQLNRKYFVEIKDEKKEEKSPGDVKNQRRIYIMPVSELKPDMKMYCERLKDKMRDFIEPIVGFEESIKFSGKDYSDEQIDALVKKNSLGLYLT